MARRAAPLVLVALVALLHAGLYAVVVAPWALEDEPQHVDYAWSIGHDQRLPTIDDEIAEPIAASEWDTDRWANYGLGAPPERTVAAMGLGGRSYLAYHPPGVYLAAAPIVVLADGDARLTLILLRGVSVLSAAVVCVLAAVLAGELVPAGRRRQAELVGGLSVALLPSLAEAGGRFNTDVTAALVVLLGVLVVRRWVADPSAGASTAVGLALAAAVLVRETTVVLAVPVVVAAVELHRRRRLDRTVAWRAFVPPVVAAAGVVLVSWRASGSPVGSRGFLDTYDVGLGVPPVGVGARQLAQRALLPFSYDGWSTGATVLSAVVVVVVGAGLVLAFRAGRRVEVAVALGMLALQGLLLAQSLVDGLTHVAGRLLLPSYPVVVAVAVAGYVAERRPAARWALPVAGALLAGWFVAADLVPAYGRPWV